MSTPGGVQVVSVPYDSAQRERRMGAGPTHLVAHGMLDHLRDASPRVALRELAPSDGTWIAEIGTAFDLDRQLAAVVAESIAGGDFPLVLSGNCITSVGTLGGIGAARTGVLWFDAHGDLNTPETTPGGFLDGMALAVVVGRCWTSLAASVPGFAPVAEEDVVLVGAGDLDAGERDLLGASAITHLDAADAPAQLEQVLGALGRRTDRVYVHVDLDVLDAGEGRANGYPGGRGLTRAQLLEAIRLAGRHCRVAAAAITAYDPGYDVDGRVRGVAFDVARELVSAAARSR